MTENITKREQIMNGSTVIEDVLTPIQPEKKELAPYPKSEYDVIMEVSLDKFKRKVNQMIEQGWMPTGGVNVVSTQSGTRFYQSMERWNVDAEEKHNEEMDKILDIDQYFDDEIQEDNGPMTEGV